MPELPSEDVLLQLPRDGRYVAVEPVGNDALRVRAAVTLGPPAERPGNALILQALYPVGRAARRAGRVRAGHLHALRRAGVPARAAGIELHAGAVRGAAAGAVRRAVRRLRFRPAAGGADPQPGGRHPRRGRRATSTRACR